MFLGQDISYTRSGTVITPDSGATVGAIHLSITGYSAVNVQGGSLDADYTLEEGFNLIAFANAVYSTLTLTFAGTGTVTWSSAGVFETDIDLTDEMLRHRPRMYRPTFSVPEGGKFGTTQEVVSEHAFEWRYLDWELVDELELLFDRLGVLGDPLFVLIPDGFEAERYDVVTTSPFDFYPSVEGNFNSGASGALVFSTV